MRAKERVTAVLCVNSEASHKLPIAIIGKAVRPLCFRPPHPVCPLPYFHEDNSWMDWHSMENWFETVFVFEVRRITTEPVYLEMDCAPSHGELQADGVSIVCLPPNTTSLYQPLYMGITAVKRRYKARLLRRVRNDINTQLGLVARRAAPTAPSAAPPASTVPPPSAGPPPSAAPPPAARSPPSAAASSAWHCVADSAVALPAPKSAPGQGVAGPERAPPAPAAPLPVLGSLAAPDSTGLVTPVRAAPSAAHAVRAWQVPPAARLEYNARRVSPRPRGAARSLGLLWHGALLPRRPCLRTLKTLERRRGRERP